MQSVVHEKVERIFGFSAIRIITFGHKDNHKMDLYC